LKGLINNYSMHLADSNYKISLNSNRIISLEEIHQHLTYAGLLEGLPTKRINKEIIDDIKNIANEKIWASSTPYILKSYESPIKLSEDREVYYKSRGPEYERIRLPKIICIGHFMSDAITDDFMFSSLTIVWFQEDWMMPIDNNILIQIKSINWDKHATQGNY